MRLDQVDTLIEQLEDFVKAMITQWQSNDAADHMVYVNMKESLKEYIIDLMGLKVTKDDLECPECGSDMIQRKNKTSGNIFYGCRKYPNCKGTRDENGLSRDERAANVDAPQQDGFSFNKKRQSWNESGPVG